MFAWAMTVCLLGSVEAHDGTIVVLENSNPVVAAVTGSSLTHVAVLYNVAGQPYIYEATPDVVRKLVLAEYCAEIAGMNRGRSAQQQVRVRLYPPARPYTGVERLRLRAFLESQIGRRYSVRGFVRNQPGDGIHCAEFVSTALARTGRYQFPTGYALSPGAVVASIAPSHSAPIMLPTRARQPEESWCQRSWAWWSGACTWCCWACHEFCTLWP